MKNKENNIWTFIPFYHSMQRIYQLTHLETLLYGFIKESLRFSTQVSFPNKDFNLMLSYTNPVILKAIDRLEEKGLIRVGEIIEAVPHDQLIIYREDLLPC